MSKAKITDDDLLSVVEIISSAAEGCRMNLKTCSKIKDEIKLISGFFNISDEQSILLSCLTELGFQKAITLDALARHLGCRTLRLIRYLTDLDVLETFNLINKYKIHKSRQHSYNDVVYAVPYRLVEALRKGDPECLASQEKYDLPSLLQKITDLVDERSEGNLSTDTVLKEVDRITSSNREIPYVAFIDSTLSNPVSKCTAFAISYWRLKERLNISIESFADALFEDFSDHLDFEQAITSGSHELMKKKILKMASAEFESDKSFALSELTLKKLYRDYPTLLESVNNEQGVMHHSRISEKKLFFNARVNSQIKEMEEMLKPSRFRSYCRTLKKNNYRMGVTAIFYGESGTGKTEAVYQLARKSGRDIFMVDLSQTKSKWFGESEKVVRQIFTDYDTIRRNSFTEPVLFINEADGLFGRRMSSAGDHSSTDQTVNTIQNILLQSLENFEGILIATTNLAGNLDGAFERRFSFRIEFPKPDAESRKSIWRSKLPDLSETEAEKLAQKFELSGGDIDVQVRQALLQKVLRKKVKLYDIVEENCRKDHGFGGRKKIGY
ncbi:MAG: AAA family ATPase [Bacteroidales bacterium]|nr:AAA family ATPase [Bacteroidales bacterium]